MRFLGPDSNTAQEYLKGQLEGLIHWRGGVAERFPEDDRNAEAVAHAKHAVLAGRRHTRPTAWTGTVIGEGGNSGEPGVPVGDEFADSIRAGLIEVALGDVRGVEVDHRSSRSSDTYTAESTGTFDRLRMTASRLGRGRRVTEASNG